MSFFYAKSRTCSFIAGNYDIAEDITQSTFLQLYMYIDELKDINIKAWMYTTAKHMALNYNKKAEREVLSETGMILLF